MSPRGRLAIFGVVVATALGTDVVVGREVGPLGVDRRHMDMDMGVPNATGRGGMAAHDRSTGSGDPDAQAGVDHDATLGGLLVAQACYRLDVGSGILTGEFGEVLRFQISGPDGAIVRTFTPQPQGEVVLVLVSRDLGTYHRLYPYPEPDGSWSAGLPELAPGAYRVFARFAAAGGPELTLGTDVMVPGEALLTPRAEPTGVVFVEGYEVALSLTPEVGAAREVSFTISQDGVPVGGLEPWLGAFAQLVAVRVGDLAVLGVQPPDPQAGGGGSPVRMAVDLPSVGTYRLFFEFVHAGALHVAAFTVPVPGPAPRTPPPGDP